MRWKIPFYRYKKPFCYLNPKTDFLILGFMNGPAIADPGHLLEGGQKLVRHYMIKAVDDISREGFHCLLMEAVILNDR